MHRLLLFVNVDQAIRPSERWYRLRVSDYALDIFSDIVEAKESPPSTSLDVLEDEAGAGVGFVAPDYAWGQNGAKLLHVANCDVFNVDQGLRQAGLERVEHAAWRVILWVWLLLLLGPNVDGPPDRVVHLDVVVEDVRDFATGARKHRFCCAWVRLHIYRFKWMVELDVQELNVVDAIIIV